MYLSFKRLANALPLRMNVFPMGLARQTVYAAIYKSDKGFVRARLSSIGDRLVMCVTGGGDKKLPTPC